MTNQERGAAAATKWLRKHAPDGALQPRDRLTWRQAQQAAPWPARGVSSEHEAAYREAFAGALAEAGAAIPKGKRRSGPSGKPQSHADKQAAGRKQLAVYLDPEDDKALREAAAQMGRQLNETIGVACRFWLTGQASKRPNR